MRRRQGTLWDCSCNSPIVKGHDFTAPDFHSGRRPLLGSLDHPLGETLSRLDVNKRAAIGVGERGHFDLGKHGQSFLKVATARKATAVVETIKVRKAR